MNFAQTEWVRGAIAVVGALSLFLGYRLFCGERTARAARITSLLSGALLAVFGIAILFADVHAGHHSLLHNTRPAWQKKSLVAPKSIHPKTAPDRIV